MKRQVPFLLLYVFIVLAGPGAVEITAEPIQVQWDVDSKQYLLYQNDQEQRGGNEKNGNNEGDEKKEKKSEPRTSVFDVFGYEVTEGDLPVPHPRLANTKHRVAEYFSLFLPNQQLSVGDSFQYSRSLTIQNDDRFYPWVRWIPVSVEVEGEVKERETIQDQETYVIHQTIEANMNDSYLSKRKANYLKDPVWSYGKTGTIEVDSWYDPEARLVRKIQYSANLTFAGITGGKSNSISEEETYTLGANHEVAGRRNGTVFPQRVREAVSRGTRFLKEKQGDKGAWDNFGRTALAVLTLLEGGVKKDDPAVEKAMKLLIGNFPTKDYKHKTYALAMSLMAFESYVEDPVLREKERKYIRGKISEEEFNQHLQKKEGMHRDLTGKEKKWVLRLARYLLKSMNKDGSWAYQKMDDDVYDNSNSQYGVLGLHAAARLGVNLKPSFWKKILSHWVHTQSKNGPPVDLSLNMYSKDGTQALKKQQARGWSYRRAPSRNEANKEIAGKFRSIRLPMVVGGIGSVQLAMTHLSEMNRLTPKLRKTALKSIRDGWAWIQANWSLRPHAPTVIEQGWNRRQYYGLYGLERAGMFTRTLAVGGHNWYEEGAELILSRQNGTSWNDSVIATSFAVLFLKRATGPIMTGR